MLWFLNARAQPVGGDVCPVKVSDATNTHLTFPDLLQEVRGRDVLIGIHGFNVNQADAVKHFQGWNQLLQLGPGVFLGALWPGDSAWVGALEYPFAAKAASKSGQSIAAFLNANFRAAHSLSFVSHSLGARVLLETVRALDPSFTVPHAIFMAPAVDDNCLTAEFADVTKRIGNISILASRRDDVLALAFPLGNPLSGIFSEGHPFWHAALGRQGPAAYPTPNNVHSGWLLPDSWQVGHGDYLPPVPAPAGYQPGPFSLPLDMPAYGAAAPAEGTPTTFQSGPDWKNWQSSWTAALTSSRFRT